MFNNTWLVFSNIWEYGRQFQLNNKRNLSVKENFLCFKCLFFMVRTSLEKLIIDRSLKAEVSVVLLGREPKCTKILVLSQVEVEGGENLRSFEIVGDIC